MDQPRVSRSQAAHCALDVLGDLLGLDGHFTTGLDSLRRVWDVINVLDDKLNPSLFWSRASAATRSGRADRLPLVGNWQVADFRRVVGRCDLFDFGRVFDRIAFGVLVIREEIVAE